MKTGSIVALMYVSAGTILGLTGGRWPWYAVLLVAFVILAIVAATELAAYQQREEAEDDTHHEALDILSEAQHDAEDLADTALRIRQKAEKWDACEREKIRAAVDAVMDEEETEAPPESGVISYAQANGRIHRKGQRDLTPQEQQRRSFAFGNVSMSNPLATREVIDEAAERLEEDDCGTTVFVRPQPAPVNASGEPLWPRVIGRILGDAAIDNPAADHLRHIATLVAKDMADRDDEGRKKYGVPIVVDNGRDHGVDAYQEALDGVVYFEGEIERQRAAGKVATAQRWQRIQDLQLQVVMMTREELDRR